MDNLDHGQGGFIAGKLSFKAVLRTAVLEAVIGSLIKDYRRALIGTYEDSG